MNRMKKLYLLGCGGVFLLTFLASFLGGWINKVDEKKLSAVTDNLVPAMEKLVPVIDKLDNNVQVIADNVDKSNEFDKLLTSIDRLEKKVNTIDENVDDLPKSIREMAKYARESQKEFSGGNSPIDLLSMKPRKALCYNRSGKVKCVPDIGSRKPIIMDGYISECIFSDTKSFTCSKQKKIK